MMKAIYFVKSVSIPPGDVACIKLDTAPLLLGGSRCLPLERSCSLFAAFIDVW
jgi:hypothetical protein